MTYIGEYFHKCVNNWCIQHGTNEQYTKCQTVSLDGKTCYKPEIRYGTTASGSRPIFYPKFINIPQWCKQLFPTSSSGTATYATDMASNANIPRKLFWGSGFNPGEKVPTWSLRASTTNGAWKDTISGISHSSVKCKPLSKQDCVMSSVTCQF